MSSEKSLILSNGSRAVGILAGGQVYIPLPTNPNEAEALRSNLNAHLGAVAAVDRVHALAAAFQAGRHIVHDPIAEREAMEEEREKIRHDRELAQELRETAVYEARLKKLQAKHRYDAESAFKEDKFDLGKARFAQRKAEAEVGEAVAREGMREEVIAPTPAAKDKVPSSAAKLLASLVDELEVAIANAEADGKPTNALRAQQDALNVMLRRKLMEEDQ